MNQSRGYGIVTPVSGRVHSSTSVLGAATEADFGTLGESHCE